MIAAAVEPTSTSGGAAVSPRAPQLTVEQVARVGARVAHHHRRGQELRERRPCPTRAHGWPLGRPRRAPRPRRARARPAPVRRLVLERRRQSEIGAALTNHRHARPRSWRRRAPARSRGRASRGRRPAARGAGTRRSCGWRRAGSASARPAARRAAARAASACPSRVRASRYSRSPAAVATTPRGERCSSAVPANVSSSRMRLESAGWETPSAAAARPRLPSSIARQKPRNSTRSTGRRRDGITGG